MKYEESSDARNTYEVAISSGSPARPIGVADPKLAFISGVGVEEGMSGVHTGPGATARTTHNFSFQD